MQWDNYSRISVNRKTISDRVFCVSLYVPSVDYYDSLRDINAYGGHGGKGPKYAMLLMLKETLSAVWEVLWTLRSIWLHTAPVGSRAPAVLGPALINIPISVISRPSRIFHLPCGTVSRTQLRREPLLRARAGETLC